MADERADVRAVLDVHASRLELVAAQIREQGDVAQVMLSEDGVSQTFSLADELWLIAYNLRAEVLAALDATAAAQDTADPADGLSEDRWQDETVDDLLDSARRIVAHVNGGGCTCPDEPHQNALHDLAHDAKRILAAHYRAAQDVLTISALIDSTYPAEIDPEAHRWRRCAKVSEECGEVTEALLGLAGENPRKGVTHTVDDVRKELLDVALAALGAVAHLDGNDGDPMAALTDHAAFVADRLRAAIAATEGQS